jgi:hypothetical protein
MNVGYADGHAKWITKLPADVFASTAINPNAPDRNYGLRRQLKLAYAAACEVWVTNLQEAVITAEQTFYQCGGFVLSSVVSRPPGERALRTAEITGKVPTGEVGTTINALAALGYVARREISGEDLSDQYVQAQRQVTQVEERSAQLQHQQATAPRVQRPGLAEKVQRARAQLGPAQDALSGVQRRTALATITATLIEKTPEVAQAAGGVATAWHSFARAAVKVGLALVWIGLYGLFAAPLAIGYVAYRRLRR